MTVAVGGAGAGREYDPMAQGGREGEPERVAMAGEQPGAIGDARDDLKDRCVAIAALPHAGGRLGDGPQQHPRPPPQSAAARTGDAFGADREHAVLPGVDLGDPHPVHAGAAQVRHQVDLGVFGNPIRAAGQRGQLLHRGREGAGIGHTGEPVVGVPPLPRVRPEDWQQDAGAETRKADLYRFSWS